MPTWETQGSNRYYREGDLLCYEPSSTVWLQDIDRIVAVREDIEREYEYVLSLYIAGNTVSLAPEARRRIGERGRGHTPDGANAIVGASFPFRILVEMLRNAGRLLGKKNPPLKFCSTIQEAMQWLAAERLRFTKAQVRPGQPPVPT